MNVRGLGEINEMQAFGMQISQNNQVLVYENFSMGIRPHPVSKVHNNFKSLQALISR